ncbi:MAG: glucose-6-phosphate isomerase [Gammaproteobacteria bacterium]|nr:glucose-6-phosphate isomerase [Gammaproteobacteria bacterium]
MLLNKLPGWDELSQQAGIFSSGHLSDYLNDEKRQEQLMFSSLDHFILDFSKQRFSPEVLNNLVKLAKAAGVEKKISGLLSGEIVNPSEERAALHSALRAPSSEQCFLDDKLFNAKVLESLSKMSQLVERIHTGQWLGYTGKPITDVVNIGVGGSDLGPLMSTFALEEFTSNDANNIAIHFASSIDGAQLASILPQLNPETTLFCLVSKSFTTIDTLSNANTAIAWMKSAGATETDVKKLHFIGASTKEDSMTHWGIEKSSQLLFWDWVGGRYSLWSAVGFSIALQIGMSGFKELLAGAHEVDKHLAHTPLENNIPVLLSLTDVWNCNFLSINAHAILPYDGRLKHFPAYLGQLEMESNGKSVSMNSEEIDYNTCPILWGEVGPNAQHAFYQLLHQGTEKVNSDFIIAMSRDRGNSADEKASFLEQHSLNISNCLAQSRVLALGGAALTDEERANLSAHQQYAGNQPSTTILMDELTPFTLGSLIAIYEHKVFVSAVLWDINPFDQWGVELGKTIAKKIQPLLKGEKINGDKIKGEGTDQMDSSTSALIKLIQRSM